MSLDLYHDAIKALASTAHGQGHLQNADGEARLDNPLCGDRIHLQITAAAGQITALAHQTQGCLLCRAAAALLGQRAPGLTEAAVEAAIDATERLLRGEPPAADAWPELALFAPAQAYRSRHKCVLLPFYAVRQALAEAGTPNGTGDTGDRA